MSVQPIVFLAVYMRNLDFLLYLVLYCLVKRGRNFWFFWAKRDSWELEILFPSVQACSSCVIAISIQPILFLCAYIGSLDFLLCFVLFWLKGTVFLIFINQTRYLRRRNPISFNQNPFKLYHCRVNFANLFSSWIYQRLLFSSVLFCFDWGYQNFWFL